MPTTGSTGYDSATATLSSSVSGFSFVVDVANLSASFKSALSSHGSANGIRVTDSTGATEYARDTIDVVHGSGTGLIRFLIPGASGTSVQVRVYPDATGVYLDSDTYGADNAYPSEAELASPNGCNGDRTSNARSATLNGGMTAGGETGPLGSASDYDGSDDSADYGDVNDLDGLSELTVITWVNLDSLGAANTYETFVSKSSSDTSRFSIGLGGNFVGSNQSLAVNIGNGSNAYAYTGSVMSTGSWQQVAFTYDGGGSGNTGRLQAYHNGSAESLTYGNTVPATTASNSAALILGGERSSFRLMDGKQSQTLILSKHLSAAEISTEHDQTDDNATFWGTWAWTAVGGGSTVNESIGLGISAGVTQAPAVAVNASIDVGLSAGLNKAPAVDVQAAVAFAVQQTLASGASVAVAEAVALAVSSGMSASYGAETVNEAIGLSFAAGASASPSANVAATVTFGTQAQLSAAASALISAGITVSTGVGVSASIPALPGQVTYTYVAQIAPGHFIALRLA